MGSEIEKKEVKDVTHPWRRQFFECKEIGKTPPLNLHGFWKKPEHGIQIDKGKK